MLHYKYLIIGGGMAADAAVRGIRELDVNGSIALISVESDPPYNRPPLSKGLWKGKPFESIWRKTEEKAATLFLRHTARALDLRNRCVTDEQGQVYTFDKLLLSTGGTIRRLPFGEDHIVYFRTAQDYRRLRVLAELGQRFAVIGGGFIGSEIAAALAMNGKQVLMVFPDETIGARVYPRDLGLFLNLRASHPDVYTAGDVAAFYNPALGKRIRVEHEDNANTMGRQAGRSMAGAPEPFHHLPFFYSDLFDLGYEAVGELDSRHDIVADWKEPNKKGVIYYMQSGRVRGVLLWNV